MSAGAKVSQQSGKRKWVMIGLTLAVGLLAAGGLTAWWAFFSPSLPWGPDMAGLAGIWREEKNPELLYTFRKDGTLLWKTKELVLGDHVWGEAGTWKRDGRKIAILPLPDRNWRVEGEPIDDGTIRSKMFSVPESDALGDVVWRRE